MTDTNTDRIERSILLRAPRTRVWRALVDAEAFGRWFGARLTGAFTPGAVVRGPVTQPGYEHITLELTVAEVVPEERASFRWHPYAIEPGVDDSTEPTTLVEFTLAEVAGGTELRVVESGFDRVPAARRAEAFRMNSNGWTIQLDNIARHVTRAA